MNQLSKIVNLGHLSDETYYQEVGDVDNLPTKTNIVDEINAQHEAIDELRNEMSGLDVNIAAHSSDEEMHITYEERKLWNTVSDKAEQSDVEELQTQADNNSSDITSLQTQIGDIETALDDKADKALLEELQATIGEINTLLEKRLDGET